MRGSAHILMMDDRALTERMFALLADGGIVTTPLATQSWDDLLRQGHRPVWRPVDVELQLRPKRALKRSFAEISFWP